MAALKIHILLFHSETPAWIFFYRIIFVKKEQRNEEMFLFSIFDKWSQTLTRRLQVGYSPTGAGAETLTLTYNIYINTHVLQWHETLVMSDTSMLQHSYSLTINVIV